MYPNLLIIMQFPRLFTLPLAQQLSTPNAASDPEDKRHTTVGKSFSRVKQVSVGFDPFSSLEIAQNRKLPPSIRMDAARELSLRDKKQVLWEIYQNRNLDARDRLDAWEQMALEKIIKEPISESDLWEIIEDTNSHPWARIRVAVRLPQREMREETLRKIAQDKTLDANCRIGAAWRMTPGEIKEGILLEIAQDSSLSVHARMDAAASMAEGPLRTNLYRQLQRLTVSWY